jgi:hypothetical protein
MAKKVNLINLRNHLTASMGLSYNRLFLIGNGFDLATGLKSGYNDFMRFYLKELLTNSLNSKGSNNNYNIKYNHYEDELFSVGLKVPESYPDFIYKDLLDTDKLDFKSFIKKILNHKSFKFARKGEFVDELMNQITKENCVDVELTYFNLVHKNRNNKDNVVLFNKQIIFFKKKLIDYLKLEKENFKLSDDFKKLMNELFICDLDFEKIKPKTTITKGVVNKNFFLNFNYTDLLNDIIDYNYLHKDLTEVNNIHGVIGDAEYDLEKIIFGYGDENSTKFKELLEKNEEELIENIKTYKYLASNNYDSLNHFINSKEIYQVIIVGHSCQLSDKVLLNEIFTNENCFSIKICHHKGSNEYMKKTMSISRITENPNHLRNIVFRFDEKDTIPQNT